MSKITAGEACDLMLDFLNGVISEISSLIKDAASNGNNCITLPEDFRRDIFDDLIYEGTQNNRISLIISELKDMGYLVSVKRIEAGVFKFNFLTLVISW